MSTIDLTPDALVTELSQAGAEPDFVTFAGWVGTSDSADAVRVYTTQALDEYLEFPAEAIVHRAKSADPAAPSTIWVKAEYEGTRVQTAGRAAQVAMLNGDMTDAFMDNDEVAGFALDSRRGGTSKNTIMQGPIVKGSSPTITAPIVSASVIISVITIAGVDDPGRR